MVSYHPATEVKGVLHIHNESLELAMKKVINLQLTALIMLAKEHKP